VYLSAETMRRMINEKVEIIDKNGERRDYPLIDPVSEARFVRIEGSAYDLTLKNVYKPGESMAQYITEDSRQLSEALPLAPIPGATCNGAPWWHLEFGKSYLLESTEKLAVPSFLFAAIKPRSTLFRAFCQVTMGDAHPNYHGKIVALVTIHHPSGLIIAEGAKFLFVRFARFDSGVTDAYDGIWGESGYDVTTNGEETRAD
jgi:deoxycytidine triphosphate deaminase